MTAGPRHTRHFTTCAAGDHGADLDLVVVIAGVVSPGTSSPLRITSDRLTVHLEAVQQDRHLHRARDVGPLGWGCGVGRAPHHAWTTRRGPGRRASPSVRAGFTRRRSSVEAGSRRTRREALGAGGRQLGVHRCVDSARTLAWRVEGAMTASKRRPADSSRRCGPSRHDGCRRGGGRAGAGRRAVRRAARRWRRVGAAQAVLGWPPGFREAVANLRSRRVAARPGDDRVGLARAAAGPR